MTPEEREAFYDREIAPALMELCLKCKDAGLPFLALVEWDTDDIGETVYLPSENVGIKTMLVAWAIRAHGNADALIRAMIKHGQEHGHNSAYLHMLGARVE
jgi:hypothetical protein